MRFTDRQLNRRFFDATGFLGGFRSSIFSSRFFLLAILLLSFQYTAKAATGPRICMPKALGSMPGFPTLVTSVNDPNAINGTYIWDNILFTTTKTFSLPKDCNLHSYLPVGTDLASVKLRFTIPVSTVFSNVENMQIIGTTGGTGFGVLRRALSMGAALGGQSYNLAHEYGVSFSCPGGQLGLEIINFNEFNITGLYDPNKCNGAFEVNYSIKVVQNKSEPVNRNVITDSVGIGLITTFLDANNKQLGDPYSSSLYNSKGHIYQGNVYCKYTVPGSVNFSTVSNRDVFYKTGNSAQSFNITLTNCVNTNGHPVNIFWTFGGAVGKGADLIPNMSTVGPQNVGTQISCNGKVATHNISVQLLSDTGATGQTVTCRAQLMAYPSVNSFNAISAGAYSGQASLIFQFQ